VKIVQAVMALTLAGTSAIAQDMQRSDQPDRMRVVGAIDGRVLVQNRQGSYLCSLDVTPEAALLRECLPLVMLEPDIALNSPDSADAPDQPDANRRELRAQTRNLSHDQVAGAIQRAIFANSCQISFADPAAAGSFLSLAVARENGLSDAEAETVSNILNRKVNAVMNILVNSGALYVNNETKIAVLRNCTTETPGR